MGKLMKYEFRKMRLSRLIILAAALIGEILFLLGVSMELEKVLAAGMIILVLDALFGIFYIGIESILILSRDLNTRQSYMLFMMPRNSYQIMGAKVLSNLISLSLAGVFFGALAAADISFLMIRIDGLKMFWENVKMFLESIFEQLPSAADIASVAGAGLMEWFLTIVIGYLAVVLAATVLAGKKLGGILSFVSFLVFCWAVSFLDSRIIPEMNSLSASMAVHGAFYLVVAILFSLLTCWIMERKLSV